MKPWKTMWRFAKPLSFFVPQLRESFDEAKYNKQVESAYKAVFHSPQGEIVLRHLISEYGLDAQMGNLPERDVAYNSAQQDVVKAILSLSN